MWKFPGFLASVAWLFGALLEDYQKDVVPIFKKVWVRLSSFGEVYSECHRGVFNKLSNVRFWKTSVVFFQLAVEQCTIDVVPAVGRF